MALPTRTSSPLTIVSRVPSIPTSDASMQAAPGLLRRDPTSVFEAGLWLRTRGLWGAACGRCGVRTSLAATAAAAPASSCASCPCCRLGWEWASWRGKPQASAQAPSSSSACGVSSLTGSLRLEEICIWHSKELMRLMTATTAASTQPRSASHSSLSFASASPNWASSSAAWLALSARRASSRASMSRSRTASSEASWSLSAASPDRSKPLASADGRPTAEMRCSRPLSDSRTSAMAACVLSISELRSSRRDCTAEDCSSSTPSSDVPCREPPAPGL
mmetsp:Transcript_52048/g.163443  ORF Transcript_52048/g.163443 Transcript_52048/m.163443 type:complete len:277 (-) Transcript_52048:144-974(-)